ncbi:MAG: hypothetical protein U0638_12695 [Phycisphaerales bacterium]
MARRPDGEAAKRQIGLATRQQSGNTAGRHDSRARARRAVRASRNQPTWKEQSA